MGKKNSSFKLTLPGRIRRVVREPVEVESYPFAELEQGGLGWQRAESLSGDDIDVTAEDLGAAVVATPSDEIEAAYQRGLEEGRALGAEQTRQQLVQEYALVAQLAKELDSRIQESMRQAEVTVVRLAYEIAKKVIHREIEVNPDMIHYVVREAVQRISNASRAVVTLNPADLERLEANKELIQELREAVDHITLKADETITPGGCTVETNVGFVDATLESQLNEIERTLFGDAADAA